MFRGVLTFPRGGQHCSYGQYPMSSCLSEPYLEVSIQATCLTLIPFVKSYFTPRPQLKKNLGQPSSGEKKYVGGVKVKKKSDTLNFE